MPKTNPAVLYIRLSPELKTVLERAAADNERTLNAEVLRRLRQSLEGYRLL